MAQRSNMDWTPKQIRMELLKKGVEQAAIARDLGVAPATIYKVIEGLSASDRVRRAIAEAIGQPVAMIWPSVYLNPDGLRGRGRPKSPELKKAAGGR